FCSILTALTIAPRFSSRRESGAEGYSDRIRKREFEGRQAFDSPARRRRLPTSTAEQQVRLVLVIAESEARDSFQGKRHRYAVIGRADAALADAKRQGCRPAPEIAIERIVLFLQRAVARLEAMLQASGPVLAEA